MTSSASSDALRVVSLVRGEDTRPRQVTAALRLIGLVGAWGPRAELDLTVSPRPHGRRTLVLLTAHGDVPEDWRKDVQWAFQEVAALAGSGPVTAPPPRHLLELKMSRDLPEPGLALGLDPTQETPGDWAALELDRQRRIRSASPWPQAYVAPLADLFDLQVPGLTVRYRLAGATDVERALLGQALERTWPDGRGSRQEYLGSGVCLRVLVGADVPVPARVRTVLSQWGSGITCSDLMPEEAVTAWEPAPSTLLGRAVPVGAALAMVRVPAVSDQPFPGLATSTAPLVPRPLDPVPARPSRPVRLGSAMAATGRRVDARLDLGDLVQHAFVQGSSGSGKSTLLAALARGVQEAGGSYTLLDPEGSTVDRLLNQTRREHAPLTRVVRHGVPQLDVPVNLFAATAETDVMIDLFAEMMQQAFDPGRQGIVGPRWRRWFALVASGVGALLGEQATLGAVATVAGDMARVRQLGVRLRHLAPEISSRISSEYGGLSGDAAAEMTSWAASKFQPLLTSSSTRRVIGTPGPGIDVLSTMDTGTSLAIDLGTHRLGLAGARVVGALWLLKFWAALAERQRRDVPHVILVDEAHLFQYGALPQLLAQARKFGVGVVVATQHLGQLTGELADALESNSATFVSLRSGLQSATRASARLESWPVEHLVRLPNLTAAAAISRDGVVTAPFTLKVDDHAKVRRLARDGHVGPHVAEVVLEHSARGAAVASGGAGPMTDQEILARLAGPKSTDGTGSQGSFLDNWLAQRAARGTGAGQAQAESENDESVVNLVAAEDGSPTQEQSSGDGSLSLTSDDDVWI